MSSDDKGIIGKVVKDMYGSTVGRAVGTITDIDGTIQTVGVDCGSQGLQQIPYGQLLAQDDIVIFIPKWRLESQRLMREKELTLRRLKALMHIVTENDDMKEDAEIIHEKYKSKLLSLIEAEKQIKTTLESRQGELNEQMKSVKMFVFDATVQFNGNEISEEVFESVKKHTNDLIEHNTHEASEIENMQRRIADLEMEVQNAIEHHEEQLQESAVTYLDSETKEEVESKLPEAPTQDPEAPTQDPEAPTQDPEAPTQKPVSNSTESAPESEIRQPIVQPPPEVKAETTEEKSEDSDWLARMEAQ